MKKIIITLLLISLTGFALYAEGSQEDTTWEPGMGRGYISEDQTNREPGTMGKGYIDQNFQRRGSMPMRGGMNTNNGSRGPAGMGYPNQNINEEKMTLTGKIDLTDSNLPKLTVGENTYELMVPYRLDYDIDIKDGDEITISGFEVPATRRTADSESTNLMVTGATFDGKEYDLDMMNNGPMTYEPVNSRHGKSGRFNNSRFSNNSGNWGPQPNGMMNRPYGRK